ncbi:MAG: hypothetical protein KME16_21835 [Scytolyngbya sp. HA4215-MV1]|jgi:hypothetical protein|nr:hypothetical protein [Scytolyngbya sp. HA4215-MV1]
MAVTATATVKRSKIANVKRVSIDHASTFLETLPDKPKEELSLREAVRQLRDQIVGALAKGYSYEELAKVLTEKGIEISPSTLKNYLPSGRRQSAKETAAPVKTRAKRGQRSADEVAVVELDAEEEPIAAPVEEPEAEATEEVEAPAVKRRRGRTAAKAVVEEPTVEAEPEVQPPKTRARRSTASKSSPTKTATRRTSSPRTTTRSSSTKGNGRRKKD